MEFIQIAWCCSAPLLLLLYWTDKSRSKGYRNLLAVSVFLLVGHSFFLMRQLAGLYQLGQQYAPAFKSGNPFGAWAMMRMMLEIILPLLAFLPLFRKSTLLPLSLLVLLYINHPVHTWNSYDLFRKTALYISLFSAVYGLFWLLNLLPDQTKNR